MDILEVVEPTTNQRGITDRRRDSYQITLIPLADSRAIQDPRGELTTDLQSPVLKDEEGRRPTNQMAAYMPKNARRGYAELPSNPLGLTTAQQNGGRDLHLRHRL